MFLMSSFRKQKSEKQKAADKRFLQAIQGNSSFRVVDGTLYVDAGDIDAKINEFKMSAQGLLRKSKK